jgi:hypothetical protein
MLLNHGYSGSRGFIPERFFLALWNKPRPRRVWQHEDSMRKRWNLSETKIEEQEESL